MTNHEYVIMLAKQYHCGSCNKSDWEKVRDEELTPKRIGEYDWVGMPLSDQDKENRRLYGHLVFFHVGRNASHEFSIAVDDQDRVFKRAIGEGYSNIEDDDEIPPMDQHIRLFKGDFQKDPGYMGHL